MADETTEQIYIRTALFITSFQAIHSLCAWLTPPPPFPPLYVCQGIHKFDWVEIFLFALELPNGFLRGWQRFLVGILAQLLYSYQLSYQKHNTQIEFCQKKKKSLLDNLKKFFTFLHLIQFHAYFTFSRSDWISRLSIFNLQLLN